MLSSTNTNYPKRYWFLAALLAGLILLTGAAWYSTPNLETTPAVGPTPGPENPVAAGSLTGQSNNAESQDIATSSAFAPFMDIVPSQDGAELFISAGSTVVSGTVFANIGVGPGNDRGGYAMVYSDTAKVYITTATGFTATVDTFAPLNITTTYGLDSGVVNFNRAYIPPASAPAINSQDGLLQLTLLSTDTFSTEAYIVVVPSYSHPGAASPGNSFASRSYSVRASGGLVTANQPMNLQITYNETLLGGADPSGLAIFAWDAFNKRWDRLGGIVNQNEKNVSVSTSRFTTYSLQVTRRVYLPIIFK